MKERASLRNSGQSVVRVIVAPERFLGQMPSFSDLTPGHGFGCFIPALDGLVFDSKVILIGGGYIEPHIGQNVILRCAPGQ